MCEFHLDTLDSLAALLGFSEVLFSEIHSDRILANYILDFYLFKCDKCCCG